MKCLCAYTKSLSIIKLGYTLHSHSVFHCLCWPSDFLLKKIYICQQYSVTTLQWKCTTYQQITWHYWQNTNHILKCLLALVEEAKNLVCSSVPSVTFSVWWKEPKENKNTMPLFVNSPIKCAANIFLILVISGVLNSNQN